MRVERASKHPTWTPKHYSLYTCIKLLMRNALARNQSQKACSLCNEQLSKMSQESQKNVYGQFCVLFISFVLGI